MKCRFCQQEGQKITGSSAYKCQHCLHKPNFDQYGVWIYLDETINGKLYAVGWYDTSEHQLEKFVLFTNANRWEPMTTIKNCGHKINPDNVVSKIQQLLVFA